MKSTLSLSIAMLAAMAFLVGCSEKKPKTDAERWQIFCKAYEGAAVNIMFDRQNGISKEEATAHTEKMPVGIQRDMVMGLVEQAQLVPKYDHQGQKDQAMEQFKQGKYQTCLDTPHDASSL